MSNGATAAVAIDAGELPMGGGLLALVRPALQLLEPGGVLAVNSSRHQLQDDLSVWCKVQKHEYLGHDVAIETAGSTTTRHLIRRGPLSVARGHRETDMRLAARDGRLSAEEVLSAVPMPADADPFSGFAPRGAQVEAGGPRYPFDLLNRDHVAPPEVASLYDQAVESQWDANRDIAWDQLPDHHPDLERALDQVFTFLAENELSALYVPSRFVSRIHPAYAEVAMFLSTQMADEARHINVFLKRARSGGGGLGVSSATEAAFLLSVLGEGTFLDLLRFIENHAPDEVTADIVCRARNDEARHVHFGMVHVRHELAHDEGLYQRLENAVRRRAATMSGVGGVPDGLQDGLTILAAGSTSPNDIARGHDAFRSLLDEMHENRIKRLEHAGFTPEQARTLSELHTPNFM